MKWFDPKFWTFEKAFGEDQIAYLTKHFEVPLSNTHFDVSKVGVEWRSFKRYVKHNFLRIEANKLWGNILSCKRKEFPNLSLLAELVFALSGSNSSVERVNESFGQTSQNVARRSRNALNYKTE